MNIEDYLDEDGNIALPEGATVTSYLERNAAAFGDTPTYRYLDYTRDPDGFAIEMTWSQLGAGVSAIGARLQQTTSPGDRVAIVAPHGVDYVASFFAAIHAGNIAVPLFAPELPGQAERLEAVLDDAKPTVVLTTSQGADSVGVMLRRRPQARRPRLIAADALPDSVGAAYTPASLHTDDIAYLRYPSGSTRTPTGVEITHRALCTNVLPMIVAGGLDMSTRSVSWFPALCGGFITLMSPLAFVRPQHRWIKELAAESAYGRTFAAAPNFAFELAAQRGLPVSESSPPVRSDFVAAFSVPANELASSDLSTAVSTDDTSERLVVVAERAAGAGRPQEAPVVEAVRAAISRQHGLAVADVRLVLAGAIPRTTSGKLARRACRAKYLAGAFAK